MNRFLEMLANNKGFIKKAVFVVGGLAVAKVIVSALQTTDEPEEDTFEEDMAELESLENAEISEN